MVYTARRAPIVSFGIGFFFISHVLESTILPLEFVFEHRNYLAIVGVSLSGLALCVMLFKKITDSAWPFAVTALLLTLFYVPQTYLRAAEWSSNLALITQAQQNKPDSARVKMEVTRILSARGRFDELLQHLDVSSQQHPGIAAFAIRSVMISGVIDRADPIMLENAAQRIATTSLKRTDVSVLKDLYLYRLNGELSWPSYADIERLFAAAVENRKKKLRASSESLLYGLHSDLLLSLNRFDEAKASIVKSTSINPGEIESTSRLVKILLLEGNHAQALQEITQLKASMHNKPQAVQVRILELEGKVLAEESKL